ncbi:MAG: 23S rRNA (guanosine(2251)-2'-O)-methyltransferase RlmB [Muribaculaceae bacterium]|jgi:23S rRNA (guanosine2251-2'-O)-methyltransferase|nr:23S rRNA (guanosine(2251)-2'-O)-methyltransferase RlmB [Muribaculaceae bacterium]
MEKNDFIFGIRAVIEAVEAGRQIDKLLVKKDLHGPLAEELMALVREHRIVTQRVPVERLNRITRKNHQGVIAMVASVNYYTLEQLVPQFYEDGIEPFVVVLDGITDVRNFGAIARTADCCGVGAIVIAERGAASVNADAVKTSAGALMSLPVCRERSIAGAVRFLKDNGYQIVAATEKSDVLYTAGRYDGPVAVVMGAEDVGISPEVLALCDTPVAIPMFGRIGSLNVSVAAGVMMYEIVRQRLLADMGVE